MENVLLVLAALACPVGMGLMMWMMAKGSRSSSQDAASKRGGSIEHLRDEQQRLADEIERLEDQRPDRVETGS